MNIYLIALFVHIAGALGVFTTLGLEWTGLRQIRTARQLEQVRKWMGILKKGRGFGFISMLATVITGVYMTLAYWRGAAWIYATLISLVLLIVLAMAVSQPRMAAIGQALAAAKGPGSQIFYNLASHPLLRISIQTRAAIALGIVFLKIAKPGWGGSLLIVSAAIVFGLASALVLPRLVPAHKGSAD